MKRIIKVVVCSAIIIVLAAVGFNMSSKSNPSNRSNQSIVRINFPVIGGELPVNVNYQLDTSAALLEKSTDYVFPFVNTTADSKIVTKLKSIFRIENAQSKPIREGTVYENDDHFLRINDDGTFVYHNKHRNDNANIDISDDACIKIAKNFLTKNNLMPPGFFENGVAYETVTSALNPKDSKILRKEVYFNRKINNVVVYGVSRIIVSIGQNGQIDSVYWATKDIAQGEPVKIKPFDTALEDLKQLKGMVRMDETTKKVIIKKVELAYWEDSSPFNKQTHVQPVYHFLGETLNENGSKGTFEGFITAVPDDLTVPVQEPDIKSTPKVPKTESNIKPPREKPEYLR
ncbi:MAG: hypothetical protein AB1510_11570 [Bacillota bacterium]